MGALKQTLAKWPAGIISILALMLMAWLTLSPNPLPEQTPSFTGADAVAHALMFGGICFCFLLDWQRKHGWQRAGVWRIVGSFAASTIIGILIEYLQLWMNLGRAFETKDMQADCAGALVVALLWYFLQSKWSDESPTDAERDRLAEELSAETKEDRRPESDASATLDANPENGDQEPQNKRHKKGKHLIKSGWIRIPLKALFWIVVFVLLLPVLVYIPPVQTGLKNIACSVMQKSTGMKVEIGLFRVGFPLNASLDDVTIIEATGDTMVRAKELIADVKLLPLFKSDVQAKRLRLLDGYYRMVAADTSMIMKIKAGLLDVSPGTSFNFKTMNLNLDRAKLCDGDVSLYMDVWKKKPTPTDTASTPMLIKARKLDIENIRFGMSMLPTIDTLAFRAKKLTLLDGNIDLKTSNISAAFVGGETGSVTYITPTPKYIAEHPAPIDTISPPSPPMTIALDSISLSGFDVLYATKGVRPAKGFDPTYISVSDLNIALKDFYNQSSSITLPITMLKGRERSGLTITHGEGTVSVDSLGLSLQKLQIRTTGSSIKADADIPFALMEMKPDARMSVLAEASLAPSDIEAFMPMAGQYLHMLPSRRPIALKLDALGSLADLQIKNLDLDIPSTLALKARGWAKNPTDFKRMSAQVALDGKLTNPAVAEKLLAMNTLDIPSFTIKGTAGVENQNYTADIDLRTSAGDLAAKGHIALNSESYAAEIDASDVNVGLFAPSLGIGHVSASVRATGAGFNPLHSNTRTDSHIHISSIDYQGKTFRDISADAILNGGAFDVSLTSPNEMANLDMKANGTINGSQYTFDVAADVHHIDLQALGLMPDMANGSANFTISGSANPDAMLFDVDFAATNLDWNSPDLYIHLPNGVSGKFLAENRFTSFYIDSDQTKIDFDSPTGLNDLIDGFMATAAVAMEQVSEKSLDVAALTADMPKFDLTFNASGKGLLSQFLSPSGIAIDTVAAKLSRDSLLTADIDVLGLDTESLDIDSLRLNIKQRNQMLDYRAHIGNRPGTLDEFARVDLMGYASGNRASLSVTQHNIENQMGYRVGLTAAYVNDMLTVHFTPLKATIAYLPWTVNADNHIDVDLAAQPMHITANLQAQSQESSIKLLTEPNKDGDEELLLSLKNIHIEDFLKLDVNAPPITACISSDMHVLYKNQSFTGSGTLNITDFTYSNQRIGDFDLDLDAGVDLNGNTNARASLLVDGQKALAAHCVLSTDSLGNMTPSDVGLTLTKFPLKIANAFLGPDVASLSGGLNGEMTMGGSFAKPVLNGQISCDSVIVTIPMMRANLKFDSEPITIKDNVIRFDDFNVMAANKNPLTLKGSVDATDFANILFDLSLDANNFQLINNDRRARSDIYGKLFLTLNATAKGSSERLNIGAKVNVLNSSDVTYQLSTDAQELTRQTESNVVTFVQFSDTTAVAKGDSVPPAMAMRINADLSIAPGTQVTVLLSGNGTDKVQLQPSGNLNYYQNYMGDMRLSGQLNLGEGMARYSLPVVGEKTFNFVQGSYVLWSGDIMNPQLNINAYDVTKATISQGGTTRPVNFKISLAVTNRLSQPKVVFDLSTDDDLAIQNEIQSMSPDQRSTQAMNLLLYGQYTGPGSKTSVGNAGTGALYSFIESQLNSWAAKNIRGVDLSFGIDQYDHSMNGQSSTSTSYSYQLSKSLFNNKFKIVVGGNYSTDASADENFSENLISDISFEYMLKQTQNLSMYVRLFRHTGWESVLEGEITETGVGFAMRRRLSNLRQLFRFGRRKRTPSLLPDSVTAPVPAAAASSPKPSGHE